MATNPASPPTIPTLVTAAIEAAGRTKKSTAQKAGIPESTFTRKMNGGADFTTGELGRIAHVLRVPAASLLPEAFFAPAPERAP